MPRFASIPSTAVKCTIGKPSRRRVMLDYYELLFMKKKFMILGTLSREMVKFIRTPVPIQ